MLGLSYIRTQTYIRYPCHRQLLLMGTDSICGRHQLSHHIHHIFFPLSQKVDTTSNPVGGGPRVVVSTAAFHARVRGSVPGLGGLKETKMFLPHPRVKVSIVVSFRDREVACSASDR